jgi:O-antigen/teichoic acid export membrane protein
VSSSIVRAEQVEAEPSPAAGTLRNVAVQVFGLNVVANVALGVVAVLSARALGPDGRGTVVLNLTIASFAVMLCGLGTNTAARYLLIAGDERERVRLGEYLGLTVVLVLAATVVGWAASTILLRLIDPGADAVDGFLTGAYSGAALAGFQLSDALHALARHGWAVGSAAVGAVAAMIGVLVLYVSDVRDPSTYLLVLAASVLVHAVVAAVVLGRCAERTAPLRSRPAWGRLLRLGRPGLVLNATQSLAFRGDRYLVGIFLGPAAVGTYSVAATLPELLRLVPYSLSEIVFTRSAADPAFTAARHEQVRRRCLALVGGLGLVAALASPVLVPLVFTDAFRDAVAPLIVLVVAELAIGSFYLDSRRLCGRGRIDRAALAAGIGLAVVLLGDLVLIPSFELIGAATASLLGYATMAVMARRTLGTEA